MASRWPVAVGHRAPCTQGSSGLWLVSGTKSKPGFQTGCSHRKFCFSSFSWKMGRFGPHVPAVPTPTPTVTISWRDTHRGLQTRRLLSGSPPSPPYLPEDTSCLAPLHPLLPPLQTSNGNKFRGTCVVQLVRRPTSVQVMISRFVGSSPASGSVLTAWCLEPASDSVSPSLSAPPPFMLCLSLSQK